MKIKILGNDLTSDNFKQVIHQLNEQYKPYGLKVKNATCYIQFEDETGNTVEPLKDGCEVEQTFTFKRAKEVN